jgi:outer membrane protein assembly factor BamD (BamD/ComL family)
MRVSNYTMIYYKTAVLLLFFFLPCSLAAQQTVYHTSSDKYYKIAFELYEKEKYNTAQKYFEKALENEKIKKSLTCEKSSFYHAMCAVKLFNEDAPYLVYKFVEDYDGSLYTNQAWFQLGGY